MSELVCIRGEIALVDPEDFERCRPYRWRIVRVGRKTNKQQPYVAARIGNCNNVYLHRFLLDAQPGQIVDHVNRNTMDCRRENLRFTSKLGNARNKTKHSTWRGRKTHSNYRGVTWKWKRKRWAAIITANGNAYQLGDFLDERLAAEAYDNAAISLHGAFANLNFPERITPLSTGLPELGEWRNMEPESTMSPKISSLPDFIHPVLRKRMANKRNNR